MSIIVFGGTGELGGLLLPELRKGGRPAGDITAAGRNQYILEALDADGYRTARVELGNPGQVRDAVAGHDQVVLISGKDPDRVRQHRHVIEAATAAGVQHLYYTSGIRADDPGFALGADHKATEDLIKKSGLRYTILRNGWYIENYAAAMNGAAQTGVFAAAVGDAAVAPAGRRDFAQGLAAVISTGGHDDRTYHLTGERDYTYHDLANAMTEVLGTPVTYQPVPAEQYRTMLIGAGLDEATAGFLTALDQSISTGVLGYAGDDLTRLIGHPTMSLTEGLRQNR
jgi:NAD(P)H dehydrogenase (quinone)